MHLIIDKNGKRRVGGSISDEKLKSNQTDLEKIYKKCLLFSPKEEVDKIFSQVWGEYILGLSRFETEALQKLEIKSSITIPKVNGISLNLINSDLENHFLSKGLYVSNYQKNGDYLIQHFVTEIKKDWNFKKKVLIQPMDGDILKQEHIKNINDYDLIITPSNIGKKLLTENGIIKPIIVIPNYYNDITPSNWFVDSELKSKKFTFYTESTGIKRKNVENLLKYFLETFNSRDDVRLIIKINEDKSYRISEILRQNPGSVQVIVLTERFNQADILSIMQGIDCYICLSYMEGFCIPVINALKMGKKIIALRSKLSGYSDFLNDENSFLVRSNKIPIDKSFESLLIWSDESSWEEADYDDYKKILKEVILSKKENKFDLTQFSKESVMFRYFNLITEVPTKFEFGDFFLPDDDGCNHLRKNNFLGWENYIDNVISNLPDNYNILDIGAHIGFITTKFSKKFQRGKIYSFEPTPLSFEYLQKNVSINNLENVELFNFALGDEVKEVGVSFNNNLFLKEVVPGGKGTQLITIDSLDLPKIDLIKIDVEGFELEVLRGSYELISKHSPILIIEIHNPVYTKYTEYLSSIGYKDIKNIGEYNYLCRTKSEVEEILDILNTSKLKWWLDFGQLLSLHRSGEPLEWKDDWDFCIVKNSDDDFYFILSSIEKITNEIFFRETNYIRFELFDYDFDFYFCEQDFENKIMKQLNFMEGGFDMNLFYYDRLDNLQFNSMIFKVPRHLDSYLLIRYGKNWKTPIKEDMSGCRENIGKEFKKSKISGLVAGVFDGLHDGHQNIIDFSVKYFDKVFIGIHTDESINYKEPPLYEYSERRNKIIRMYPQVEIIENCPLVTDEKFLDSINCDFVIFGQEESDNINFFYPSEDFNHSIDRYPILSSRLIRNVKIKSFCINLEHREDKFLEVLNELSKSNIYPNRFKVRNWNLIDRIKREGVSEKLNQILQSHLELYKYLITLKDDYFLVLEDDVILINSLDIEDIIKSAPSDWDVIFLGGLNHYKSPMKVNERFYRCKMSFNANAFIIKKNFIEKIIPFIEKREFENDVIFGNLQNMSIGNWYGVIDDIIIQNGKDSPTTITTTTNNYEKIKLLKGNFFLSKIELRKFNKIFQIGFNKCGTTSINQFLEDNGLESVHYFFDNEEIAITMFNNISNNKKILNGLENFDSFTDMESPTSNIFIHLTHFRELDKQYPNSKFILNIRNVDDWILSRLNHEGYLEDFQKNMSLTKEEVIKHWKNSWQDHIDSVKKYFSDRPDDLLIFDINSEPDKFINFCENLFELKCREFKKLNHRFFTTLV